MNAKRLAEMVWEATNIQNGDEVNLSIYEIVDCHLRKVCVDKLKAKAHKEELSKLMKEYPQPDRLKLGPSYIELAGAIFEEDQDTAIRLMALGKVAELWDLITPETMGVTGEDADRLAHNGMVTIDEYKG